MWKANSGHLGENPLARLKLILLGWGPRHAFSQVPSKSHSYDLRNQGLALCVSGWEKLRHGLREGPVRAYSW